MIQIDDVYQRVLVLANKEQRGYITPQEFNLFANQAQLEIFEQYCYDINQYNRSAGNETEYSDLVEVIDEKLDTFRANAVVALANGIGSLPTGLHKLGTVFTTTTSGLTEVDRVSPRDIPHIFGGPLTNPAFIGRYVYYTGQQGVNHVIYAYPQDNTSLNITYIRKPNTVAWGWTVIGEKAMYDPNVTKTFNFELHPSEETELVYRILGMAGVAIKRQEVAQAGIGMAQSQVQQEKQ
tara:strand:+ start:223 stop:933 length:711 start_codon:yes stop_codon:yes gene_type:complete